MTQEKMIKFNNLCFASLKIEDAKIRVIDNESINDSFSVFVSQHGMRAFVVADDTNVALASVKLDEYQLNSILDNEDINHEEEIDNICNEFVDIILDELWLITRSPVMGEHKITIDYGKKSYKEWDADAEV